MYNESRASTLACSNIYKSKRRNPLNFFLNGARFEAISKDRAT